MTGRIWWTTQEIVAMAHYDPAILTEKDASKLRDRLFRAQTVLDDDRKRESPSIYKTLNDSGRLRELIAQAATVISISHPKKKTEPERTPEGDQKLRQAIKSMAEEPAAPAAPPAPVIAPLVVPGVLNAKLHEFVDTFVATVMLGLQSTIQKSFEETLAQYVPKILETHNAQVQEQVRATLLELLGPSGTSPELQPVATPQVVAVNDEAKLPRVDVVGLLGQQAEIVRRHASNVFDLRFLTVQEIRRRPVTAPHAVMATKFVDHAAFDRIRKGGAEIVFANGGIESVLGALDQIRATH